MASNNVSYEFRIAYAERNIPGFLYSEYMEKGSSTGLTSFTLENQIQIYLYTEGLKREYGADGNIDAGEWIKIAAKVYAITAAIGMCNLDPIIRNPHSFYSEIDLGIGLNNAFMLATFGLIAYHEIKANLKFNMMLSNVEEWETGENQWYNPDGSIKYPPNGGAIPGTEMEITVSEGHILGRYGKVTTNSDYVTLAGTSPDSLSLPPDTNSNVYAEYVVVKPIPGVTMSTAMPWGGCEGGGIQFKLPMTILQLIRDGYIKQIL